MNVRCIIAPAVILAGSTSGYATVYLTAEQAQAAIFPAETFVPTPVTLTAEQKKSIEAAAGVRVRSAQVQAWRSARGAWLIVDQVLGKHELITFAVGIQPDGSVKQIEILEYRETYGDGVRGAGWRNQFVGKTAKSELKLDADIKNISGATLSSRHVTDGVRRLLATYEIALRSH